MNLVERIDRLFRTAECPVCGGYGELMCVNENMYPCGACRPEDFKLNPAPNFYKEGIKNAK